MFEEVALPIAAAVGLSAWPAIVSVRVRRWGQALLLIAASVAAPYVGIIVVVVVMSELIQPGSVPYALVPLMFLAAWIAAIVVPLALGFALHLLGRYTSPAPRAATEAGGWRTPDA